MFCVTGILKGGFAVFLAIILSRLIYVMIKQFMLSSNIKEKRKGERKMDFFESVLDEFHTIGGANMCCGFRLKSKSSLSYNDVYDTLNVVSKKYPLLRTVIVQKYDGENKMVKYLRVVNNKSMVTVHILPVQDWVSVWENEVLMKFDCETGPLWHTTLLEETYDALKDVYTNTILFTFYHGTMDGLAVLKFVQEFVKCLNGISKGILSTEDNVKTDILPGLMTLLTAKQFLHFKIIQWILPECLLVHFVKFAMRVSLMFDVKNPVLCQFGRNTDVGRGKIKIIPRQLNSGNTKKLITVCRRNACTVYGALLACCHLAVSKLVESGKTADPLRFGWYCPVNVRDQCKPRVQPDDLGSYTTVLMENVNVPDINTDDQMKFWSFAKQCTKEVHNGIRNSRHLFSLYLTPISHLLNPKQFVSEFILHSKMKQSELMSPVHSLSNLGKIDWKKDKNDVFEIESVFGGSGAYQHGPSFVNHMATFNGVFIWSTSYITSVVNEETAEKYVNLVFEILRNILSSSGEE